IVAIGLALVTVTANLDVLAMTSRGWAFLAAYLLVVLLRAALATALAVLTRSVSVAVAAPITSLLPIVQLASVVPILEAITRCPPFNASHMLLAQALGEAPAGVSVWSPAVALLVPALALAGAGLCAHVRRDTA